MVSEPTLSGHCNYARFRAPVNLEETGGERMRLGSGPARRRTKWRKTGLLREMREHAVSANDTASAGDAVRTQSDHERVASLKCARSVQEGPAPELRKIQS